MTLILAILFRWLYRIHSNLIPYDGLGSPTAALTIEDLLLRQPVDVDAPTGVLPQLEVGRRGIQEVCDGLIVDLQAAAAAVVPQDVTPLQQERDRYWEPDMFDDAHPGGLFFTSASSACPILSNRSSTILGASPLCTR